ncbi:hypothetical protein IWX90DRAFT_252084 [Phyllosticta citrichinensis]|uniref:Uncharacterized protein n=1 Tax=Phyllosticta citrichinensis TaxID=1130410 RepID=A0ABR1XRB2_9PEZI
MLYSCMRCTVHTHASTRLPVCLSALPACLAACLLPVSAEPPLSSGDVNVNANDTDTSTNKQTKKKNTNKRTTQLNKLSNSTHALQLSRAESEARLGPGTTKLVLATTRGGWL